MSARAFALLIGLVVLGWCVLPAEGYELVYTFTPDRDNGSNSAGGSHPGEWHSNAGLPGAVRIKASDHQYYADWDTAEIAAIADGTLYGCTYTLNVVPHCCGWSDSGASTPVTVAAVWSETDWVEGNGANYNNYNWTNPTTEFAATYMHAQDIDTSGGGTPVPWVFPGSADKGYPRFEDCTFLETFLDGGDKRTGGNWHPWTADVKTVGNTEQFIVAYYHEGKYQTIALDDELVDDLLHNEHNRGLVLFNLPPEDIEGNPDFFNKNVRTREYGNFEPYIEMTIPDIHNGDLNVDGKVDYVDLGVLATNYDLTGTTWGDGDFNGDGKVDYVDLGMMATEYDWVYPGKSEAPEVPEPVTTGLLAAGACLGLLVRTRVRRAGRQ